MNVIVGTIEAAHITDYQTWMAPRWERSVSWLLADGSLMFAIVPLHPETRGEVSKLPTAVLFKNANSPGAADPAHVAKFSHIVGVHPNVSHYDLRSSLHQHADFQHPLLDPEI